MTRLRIVLWTMGILMFACGKSENSDLSAKDCRSLGECRSMFPENDLWKDDRLNPAPGSAFTLKNMIAEQTPPNAVSESTFREIIRIGLELYTPVAKANREKLFIDGDWKDSTVNADCKRSSGRVRINMYGGFARRPEVTPEGFALVLCHELGHAYGGTPTIWPSKNISVEGQADFYGAGACLEKLLERLPGDPSLLEVTPYMQHKCSEKHLNNPQGYDVCLRQLASAQSLGKLIANVMKKPVPDFETPDQTQVKKTLEFYPKTAQCRVDSFHNAILGLPRPACWFKK